MSWIIEDNLDPKLQDWGEAYKELCVLIKEKVPEVKHIDLYYGQDQLVEQDGNWNPFPCPAVLLSFKAAQVRDLGDNTQELHMDITMYLYLETVQDTHHGSAGQRRAMEFVGLMRKLHTNMHGASGEHFSPLSRVEMAQKADAPPYAYVFGQTYRCVLLDNSTSKQYNFSEPGTLGLEITPHEAPPVPTGQLVVVRNSDDTYSVTIEAPDEHLLADVTHTDSDGTPVTRPAMTPFVATVCVTPDPVQVRNSDNSFGQAVTPPGPLILADVTHTDSDGQPAVRPAMVPFVATPAQPAQLYDSESNLIALIPAGASASVPSGALYYEDAAGILQPITGVPLVLVGDQLFLQWSPDRFIVFKSNGITIHATRDILSPSITVPKMPVRNSLNTQISEHEVGDPGIAGDSVITRPDASTFGLPATVPFDIRVLRSGIVYDFGQMLHTGQLTVFRAGDEASLHAAGWFNYTPPPYPASYASLASFSTLSAANMHGNTLRFTDRAGAAAATSGDRIIQDHLTGLEWYLAATLLTGTWTAAIDAAEASTVGGSTDWHLPPEKALETISDYSLGTGALNYAPFNIANNILTGTTYPADTASVRYYTTGGGVTANIGKTSSQRYIFCRRFI